MSSNRLKLNPDKTELLWASTKHNLNKQPLPAVRVRGVVVKPTTLVKSLGVQIDEELKLSSHVSSICRSCYFHLRQIRQIRRYLNMDSAKTLVQSFVTNRIDYCNSLLANAPSYQTDQLQRVLNAAARLVLRLNRSVHELRPLVKEKLHWLRAPERITYKLCTLTFKALHGTAPVYLQRLCVPVETNRRRAGLRSGLRGDLLIPRHRLATYGPRAFCIAAPMAWNALPVALRCKMDSYETFCSKLKEYLFTVSYNC